MDDEEIAKSAALEERHWWYAERRAMVRRTASAWPAGRGLDVGCAGGGNTAVLRDLGWSVTGLEYSRAGAEIARSRGLDVVRGDGTRLPFPDATFDLVMATDVWEHIEDDRSVASETARVLRPGGRVLVAVPCSMKLWSGHDVALGHFRRYEREQLIALVSGAGLEVVDIWSWNVLLRPVVRARRRKRMADQHSPAKSEMEPVHPVLNAGLRTAVRLERVLPLRRLPGVSLVVSARKP